MKIFIQDVKIQVTTGGNVNMARIGIDLGTTNSLVSYWRNGELQLLRENDGSSMFSSAVCFMEDGILVGNEAKERFYQDQEHTVTSFKCDMGSDKTYMIDGKSYTPALLSSMVLKLLKDNIENELGEEIINENDEEYIMMYSLWNHI